MQRRSISCFFFRTFFRLSRFWTVSSISPIFFLREEYESGGCGAVQILFDLPNGHIQFPECPYAFQFGTLLVCVIAVPVLSLVCR